VAEVTGAVTEASLLSMIEDLLGVTPG